MYPVNNLKKYMDNYFLILISHVFVKFDNDTIWSHPYLKLFFIYIMY